MTIFLLGAALAVAVNLALTSPANPLSLGLLGALAVVWTIRIVDPMRPVREQVRNVMGDRLPPRARPRRDV
jgi:hypothetical protein